MTICHYINAKMEIIPNYVSMIGILDGMSFEKLPRCHKVAYDTRCNIQCIRLARTCHMHYMIHPINKLGI